MNNPFEDYLHTLFPVNNHFVPNIGVPPYTKDELTMENKKFNSDDFFTEIMLRGIFNAMPLPEQTKGFKDAALYLLDHGVPGTVVLHAMSLILEGFKTNETDED